MNTNIENLNGLNTYSGFPAGNLETNFYFVFNYLPKAFTYVSKTIFPIVDATMIELFGSYDKFKKTKGEIKFFDSGAYSLGLPSKALIRLTFYVQSIKNASVDQKAVETDKFFIISKLNSLTKGIYVSRVSSDINIQKGEVYIDFIINIGAL